MFTNSELARASTRLHKKETCRMSSSYSGCKHAPVSIFTNKAIAVDLRLNYLVEESETTPELYNQTSDLVLPDVTFVDKEGNSYKVAIKP